MSRYTVNASVANGSTLPIVNIVGSSAIRVKLYEYILGSSSTPNDYDCLLKFFRTTAVGTGGTSLTVYKVDPLTVSATATAKRGTFSGAPTAGDELQAIAINQRSTYRWIARPGAELVATAAADNGIMLRSESASSSFTVDATLYWEE